jgi:beta-galactosidase
MIVGIETLSTGSIEFRESPVIGVCLLIAPLRPSFGNRCRRATGLSLAASFLFFMPTLVPAVRAASGTRSKSPILSSTRQVRNFNDAWRFLQSDADHAEEPGFDDSKWRSLSVPHDWSIAGPVAQSNLTGQGGGYFPNGIGWYRKEFSLSQQDSHRHLYIVFDGVMANSDVWINGFHLGHRPNGTVSFLYELTGHLQFRSGAHNVLAVRCDNSQQPASRWYEGAGIYRSVRLVSTEDLHLDPWSVFVTTPTITADKAVVHVQSTVVNEGSAEANTALTISLIGPDGRTAATQNVPAQTIAKGGTAQFNSDINLTKPALWDIDSPQLYRAIVQVKSGGTITDDEQQQFGVREFHFDADTGFWLNGRNFKLKGAALHIDGGAVGIAVPTAVYEHRLLALRALGVNAIRTAHNPQSPEFLDLCDRLGFLVMDEMFDAWTVGKNPYDYHLFFQQWSLRDTRDAVRRDRNHPSIILYSAGNEIHDTPHEELAHKILSSLVTVFHENDPTRPVTQALFRPNVSHDYDNGLADLLDVVGQNYREKEILAAHEAKPTRKIVGTENGHDRDIWLALRDHPPYSGQFLWTGIDYLGEAREGGDWPLIGNGSGLLDRTAYPRARAFERQSWWASQPNVHIARRIAPTEHLSGDPGYESAPLRFRQSLFLDWTPQNPAPHNESVEVYTNCEEVELFLDGVSLGKQQLHPDASALIWKVAYAPGALKAVAYNHGQQVAEDELHTAGEATHLVLSPERNTVSAGAEDLVYVEASLNDRNGNKVSGASTLIHFSVSGPGTIVAVDNGSNADHDSFQIPQRHAYQGRAVVLIRATAAKGTIQVTASAPGLTNGTTLLKAIPVKPVSFIRSF